MAVTRIKNNQITDSTITGSKLVEKTITSGLLEDNLTYSSDFTISGNLTVSGTTSTVDTTNTLVADPLLVLSRGETGTPSQDSGFIIERGTSSNVGFIWDESEDVFALVNTTEDGSTAGDIAISSYADAIVADITASSGSIGNIDISGNSIVSSDTNGDISLIPNGAGDINLSSDTVVVGDSNVNATVTTNGTGDLILNTNSGTDSGSITIADGANGDITIAPNGTGSVNITNLVNSDLTDNRIVLAGTGGAFEDSADLTFDGTTLSVGSGNFTVAQATGNVFVAGTLETNGEATLASAVIEDLTSGRVVLAGTSGAVEDSANLTFDGTSLSVTGNVVVDNITIDANTISSNNTSGNINLTPNGSGEVVASTLTVSDLTDNRVVLAGTSGALEDSANLTFDGSTLSVTGVANVSSDLNVDGEATLASATISDLTDNRVLIAGTSGAVEDSANLTFDGTSLSVTGNVVVDNITIDANTISSNDLDGNINLTPNGAGEVVAASMTVSDLTENRLVVVGPSGALEDDANLTFDGSTLSLTGVANISSDLNVSGESTLASATVSDLTDNRLVVAGTGGSLEDDANLTWDGSALAVTGGVDVTGDLDVDNLNFNGNDITSTNSNGDINLTPDGTGEVVASTLVVSDLTDNRVLIAGASGAVEDSANMTFDGTTLNVTGNVTVDNITIDGDTISSVHDTITIDPATAGSGGTVVIAGNLEVTGTTTTVDSTVVTIADPVFQLGEDSDDSLDRGIKALYNDGIESKNAFFGLDESATEFVFIADATDSASVFSGSLGAAAFGSLRVTDLSDNRVLIAGASGEVEDSANLTFDGTTLTVTGAAEIDNVQIDGNTITTTAGNLNIDSNGNEVIIDSLSVSDLTDNRVLLAGTSGALEDSANLTFDGSTLVVTGVANVSSDLNVSGEATLASATVSDLTSGRVTLAGTAGSLEDSANLTFDGSLLSVTGTANVSVDVNVGANLDVTTQATLASASVTDLTDGRVVLAGTAGELEDSANLTFNGTTLSVTGVANVSSNLNVSGEATLASATVSDLTSGRVTYAGVDGALVDSANLAFDGTNLTVSSATVSDLTSGRVVLAGTSGAVEDSANLTFDGSTLVVTGVANVSSDLNVDGEATLASATVSDLTDNRLVVAGTGGSLEDDANLTWDGSALAVTGGVDVTGDLDIDNINIDGNAITSTNTNGNIDITPDGTGATNITNLNIAGLTADRVMVTDSSGTTATDDNLSWDGTTLGVTGNVTVDNITIDGDTISSAHSTLTIDPASAGTGGTVVIAGDLTVQGTTTTVDSTVVTIADPVFQLGEDTADSLDRGIKALYNDGTSKTAFFGLDESASEFIFIEDATDTSSVFSGSLGAAAFGSLRVTDLTDNRVLLAGTSGEVEDSANLTFDGSTLTVTGVANISSDLNVSGEATLASATVSDLTAGRVTLAGVDGALEDSANLTFDGSTLTVTGVANVSSNLNVTGEATLASATVSDLTSGRVTLAGTSGALEDSANLTFDGSTLTVTGTANVAGALNVDNVQIDGNSVTTSTGNLTLTSTGGEVTATSLAVSDLTSGRVTLAGTSGALEDSANLTFDGSTLAVTGVANVSSDLNVSGEATLASATVSDLTSGRVTLAGTSGALEDSANLTFDGSTLTVTGTANISVANISSDLNVSGEATLASATVSDLTSGRVVLAGVDGAIEDSANLAFDGTTLTVTGVANVSSDLNVDGEATLASATVSDLISGRVVLAGVDGAIEDSANLAFDGTTLTVTGIANISANLNVSGESTLASATVSDLTDNRLVVAGTGGSLEDDANLTWDGSALAVTGGIDVTGDLDVDNLNFDGNAITSTNSNGNIDITPDGTGATNITNLNISGLTAERVMVTDSSGTTATDDNLSWDGTDLGVTGSVTVDNITVDGDTISSVHDTITIDPSTAGSGGTVVIEGNLQVTGTTTTVDSTVVTIADPVFQLGEDSDDSLDRGIKALYNDGVTSKNAFFGLDESATEFVFIADATDAASVFSGSLGAAAFGSLRVTDLTDTRITFAGANGELQDSAGLTFDGTTLSATALEVDNVQIDGNTITTTAGNLNIDSNGNEVLIDSLTVNDLTDNRVLIAGTSGAVEDSANLTFDGSTLSVTGVANVSSDLNVSGEATLASATVSDLTSGRVTLAGAAGSLEDSVNLTFDGSTLTVTGVANVSSDLNVSGEATLASATVSDLTSGRVTLAGAAGSLEDSANLTFDGSTLTVTGVANVSSDLNVDGEATLASATVSDLTASRLTYAGVDGALIDNANLTFSGTTLTVTGVANVSSDLNVDGEATLASATVSDLTASRLTYAGVDGALIDNANLTFDGSTLTVTGVANVSSNLNVTGEATLASATVSDLTSGRVTLAGAAGSLEDSANLTFDGSTLTVTGTANVAGALNVDNVQIDGNSVTTSAGNLTLDSNAGEVIATSLAVSDLTAGRVTLAGTSGALEDSANLTFDGSTLVVTGVANVSSDLNVSGESTLASATVSDLTSGRVTLAGTAGSLEDSANLTFNGTTLTTTQLAVDNVTVDANTVSTSDGNLTLDSNAGEVIATSLAVSDLTATRVTFAGTNGALEDSANLTFDGTSLGVTGNVVVDNITIDGNSITSSNALTLDAASSSSIVVNEAGADVDFRVESDTEINALFIEGSSGNIGVRTAAPTTGATITINSTDSIILPNGTTAQRPGTAAEGMMRYNSTLGQLEFYDSVEWKVAGAEFTIITADSFEGDGSTVAFTLSEDSTSAGLLVSLNGVVQDPGTAYSVSGTTLTFTEAPASGDNIDARIITTTASVTQLTDGNTSIVVDDATPEIRNVVNGTTIFKTTSGGVVPNANVTYDLGTDSLRWKDLYLSGSSIYLGDLVIKDNGDNSMGVFQSDGVTEAVINVSAEDAAKWSTARTITLGGDLTGNVSIDGSSDVTLTSTVVGDIEVDTVTIGTVSTVDGATATLATASETASTLYDAASYAGAKLVVSARDTVTGETQMSELLITNTGSAASATEYGVVHTGASPLATYDVDVSGGDVRLLITGASSNSTKYQVSLNLMKV